MYVAGEMCSKAEYCNVLFMAVLCMLQHVLCMSPRYLPKDAFLLQW